MTITETSRAFESPGPSLAKAYLFGDFAPVTHLLSEIDRNTFLEEAVRGYDPRELDLPTLNAVRANFIAKCLRISSVHKADETFPHLREEKQEAITQYAGVGMTAICASGIFKNKQSDNCHFYRFVGEVRNQAYKLGEVMLSEHGVDCFMPSARWVDEQISCPAISAAREQVPNSADRYCVATGIAIRSLAQKVDLVF